MKYNYNNGTIEVKTHHSSLTFLNVEEITAKINDLEFSQLIYTSEANFIFFTKSSEEYQRDIASNRGKMIEVCKKFIDEISNKDLSKCG